MRPLRSALALIALITLGSGLLQLVAPGLVLRLIGAERSATTLHFFALVGMFMALFGGATWQALRAPKHNRLILFWSGMQKLGAVAGVGIGVWRDVFGPLALGVALFDALSAGLLLYYWNALQTDNHHVYARSGQPAR